ncbi:proline-rich transmembrane protein 1 [Lingula anatina]|uniref:Proline-rich transmembrane protein 1 n=1 Tax=Lingula anatina TaxID=7574 RepID=A0A1S3K0T8_LINAN|nr:proline-rich transmembrane protein 1-like [Lingula anatina]XP_013415989.1 proline-rich transmembrane protein 1 [Lingula anatina]|eukprot:XP_013401965.1 proline-rich transmembrane protein 1-like [Lingula anatina]
MSGKEAKAQEAGQQQGYPQGQPPQYDPAYPPQGQYYNPQAGAYNQPITGQPQIVVYQQQPAHNIPDQMGYAIFVTLCCCWPMGIMAIVKALASRDAIARGDLVEGKSKAEDAKRWSHWALGVGIAFFLIIVVFLIVFYTAIFPGLIRGDYD